MTSTVNGVSGRYAIVSAAWSFVAALVVVAGATQWFPRGAAEIDHIVLPALLFPVLWIALVISLLVGERRRWTWGASGFAVSCSLAAAALGFMRGAP